MSDTKDCPPQRTFVLISKVSADSRDDLVQALNALADGVARNEITVGISGGVRSGAIYELLHDSAQTHEKYFQELADYLNKERTK